MSGEANSRRVLRSKKAAVACAKRNAREVRGDSVAARYRSVLIPEFAQALKYGCSNNLVILNRWQCGRR
jgi:hypothetical protein